MSASSDRTRISEHMHNIRNKSLLQQWAHTQSSYVNQRWSWGITFPSLVINSIMAVLSQNTHVTGVSTTISIVFVLNALLATLKDVLKLDQRVQFHTHQATGYGKLASEIEHLLVTSHLSSADFTRTLNQFSTLTAHTAYLIPESIMKRLILMSPPPITVPAPVTHNERKLDSIINSPVQLVGSILSHDVPECSVTDDDRVHCNTPEANENQTLPREDVVLDVFPAPT